MLIGANGAGKSNFLAFFRFMQQLARGELQRYVQDQGGADRIVHFGIKRTKDIVVQIEFELGAYEASLAAGSSGRLFFTSELCIANREGGGRNLVDFLGSDSESKLSQRRSEPALSEVRAHIESWRVYHFHDTTSTAAVKQSASVSDNVALHSDGGNLAAFLRRIRDTVEYGLILRSIQRVAPFFHDFVLIPEDTEEKYVYLRWSHRGTDKVFGASDLSDGTLRFICLATVLLQPQPPDVIILDEPELGLHPYALHVLAGLIQAMPIETQVIASTQSVTLANQFDIGDVLIVDRVDEATSLRRSSPEELSSWLGEYGMGDLWEKNILGGTPG